MTTMTCDTALDRLLDSRGRLPDDDRGLSTHIGDCPTCREEMEMMNELADIIATAETVAPPPDLEAAVMAGIAEPRRRPATPPLLLVAAAIIGLLLLVGSGAPAGIAAIWSQCVNAIADFHRAWLTGAGAGMWEGIRATFTVTPDLFSALPTIDVSRIGMGFGLVLTFSLIILCEAERDHA